MHRTYRKIESHIDRNFDERGIQFLTWSIRNDHNLNAAWTDLKRVEQRFKRTSYMRKSRKQWHPWHDVYAFAGVWEITNKGNGWNVHCHMILNIGFTDYKSWVREWRSSAHDEHVGLKFVEVKTDDVVGYLTKYMSKSKGEILWGGLDAATVKANRHFFKGKRVLRRSQGKLPKLPPKWFLCCMVGHATECGYDLWKSNDLDWPQKKII